MIYIERNRSGKPTLLIWRHEDWRTYKQREWENRSRWKTHAFVVAKWNHTGWLFHQKHLVDRDSAKNYPRFLQMCQMNYLFQANAITIELFESIRNWHYLNWKLNKILSKLINIWNKIYFNLNNRDQNLVSKLFDHA